jgi:ubiquinone/menaquinone biosynthesis C-methylase UbiE
MNEQTRIFLNQEGDRYYQRNRSTMLDPKRSQIDPVVFLMKKHHLKPKHVLEIGSSMGWRLGYIQKHLGARCLGIEPSQKAVRDGKKLYPRVSFKRGLAENLPVKPGQTFDLVIVYFVLHWVSRESILKAIAEIDRVVAHNGYLILGDFLPSQPERISYHYVPTQRVYTYKQDYSQLFTASHRFRRVGGLIFNHDTWKHTSKVPSDIRGMCALFKKSNEGYYRDHQLKGHVYIHSTQTARAGSKGK